MNARPFLFAAVLAAALAFPAAVSRAGEQAAAEPDPELMALDTASLVRQLLDHPFRRRLYPVLQSPRHRAEALRLLLENYRQPDLSEAARGQALRWLARAMKNFSQETLVEAAGDESALIRAAALASIGYAVSEPTPDTRQAVLRGLDDPHPLVIHGSLIALQRLPDPAAAPRIREIITDPPPVFTRHGIPAAVYGYSQTDSDELRRLAIGIAGILDPGPAAEIFLGLLEEDNDPIRQLAIEALVDSQPRLPPEIAARAREAIAAHLTAPNRQLRVAAAAGLAQFGDGRGAGILLAQLEREEAERSLREFAAETLARLTGQDWGEDPPDFWDYYWNENREEVARRVAAIRQSLADNGYPTAPPRVPAPALTAAEKETLAGLFALGLCDPRGRERVEGLVQIRTCWGHAEETTAAGWLLPAADGLPERLYLDNLHEVAAPAEREAVDFLEPIRQVLGEGGEEDAHPGELIMPDREAVRPRYTPVENIIWAAWLVRLGHEAEAAEFYRRGRGHFESPEELRQIAHGELAWQAFNQAVNAFIVGADDEALRHLRGLRRHFPEKLRAASTAVELLADLERREAEGTLNSQAPELPEDFAAWDTARRVEFLINALDQVHVRQWGQPGGVNLAAHPLVQALIEIGDPAVPALIDCIERDRRLTRSIHFWRDFSTDRTVLGVREAALSAVMSILRVEVFSPASTGDNFTARGEEGADRVAAELRAYWEHYGRLPFPERMLTILRDPQATGEALREAAINLVTAGQREFRSTTIFSNRFGERPPLPPSVLAFADPTAAEAILAAMERDLEAVRNGDAAYAGYGLDRIEDIYIWSLTELGDRRILPRLREIAGQAALPRLRRKWALACHQLGDSSFLVALAGELEAGTLRLLTPEEEGDLATDGHELGEVISALIQSELAEGDRALLALARPEHPAHDRVYHGILQARNTEESWFGHPFCLSVLARALDDAEPTGRSFRVEEDRLIHEEEGLHGSSPLPYPLVERELRAEPAAERQCDVAAQKLKGLVLGLPGYHPLLADADEVLERHREFMRRFSGRFRLATETEVERLWLWPPCYLPDIPPLERPATAADVAAGRAVFHLEGGQAAPLELPAVVMYPRETEDEDENQRPVAFLVVQAERDAAGSLFFGVIAPDGLRRVPAAETTDPWPVSRPLPDEEEAETVDDLED